MFVTHGIIYVESSVGRMANTYMENSDNFLTYAFTNVKFPLKCKIIDYFAIRNRNNAIFN